MLKVAIGAVFGGFLVATIREREELVRGLYAFWVALAVVLLFLSSCGACPLEPCTVPDAPNRCECGSAECTACVCDGPDCLTRSGHLVVLDCAHGGAPLAEVCQ